MKINSVDNNQSFGSIYKVKLNYGEISKLDQHTAKSFKDKGGKFVAVCGESVFEKGKSFINLFAKSPEKRKNVYVFTNEDCVNFMDKYNDKFYHGKAIKVDNYYLKNVLDPSALIFNKVISKFFKKENVEELRDLDELTKQLLQ